MVFVIVVLSLSTFIGVVKALTAAQVITRQSCLDRQHGWDNRQEAWILLTEPPVFAPTTDPERIAAEKAITDQDMSNREFLLAGLGPRPDC